MKIARHIGDLLYDYECVVIPGLGGFITNDKPASINPVNHQFKPPFKQVFFNAQLQANDGLLVNYIAKENNLIYKEAKTQLDSFVLNCHNALKEGKRINFHRIGYLYFNNNEQIVFQQDTTINYNAETFGLSSFVSPAVRRLTQEEKIKEMVTNKPVSQKKMREQPIAKKTHDRKISTPATPKVSRLMKAEKRKKPYRSQLTFVILLLAGMFTIWGFMHKGIVNDYYQRYSSTIPFFYASPQSYLVNNIGRIHFIEFSKSKKGIWFANTIAKLSKPNSDNYSSNSASAIEKENTIKSVPVQTTDNDIKPIEQSSAVSANASENARNTPEVNTIQQASLLDNLLPENENNIAKITTTTITVAKKVVPVVVPQDNIFIIAGSFKSLKNAKKLMYHLQNKGYQAILAGTNGYGLYRVSYGRFGEMKKAEEKLLAVRKNDNPHAWILYK